MIELDRVTKTFAAGSTALTGVSLRVEAGEVVALLGRSGAGKSTLLRCVNGFVQPTSGRVVVDGREVSGTDGGLRALRRVVAMVFQQFNLVGRLTVLENVLTGTLGRRPTLPTLLRRFPPEDYEMAERCLDRVGLADRCAQRVDSLSGGERQRVGIARALAQRPRVLLADEPVASLDPRTAVVVLDLLQAIVSEQRLTMLLSLHQVELARRFADRVVGLTRGTVSFEGSASALTDGAVLRIYEGVDEALEHA
jgi:phosphonate transport system ATP-binding protein